MKIIAKTLILLLLARVVSLAQTTINVPADQPTVQAGIDAAVDGDTVLVAEGAYTENINYLGKKIFLASLFLSDGDTSHISKTIIDGSSPAHPDTGSVVTFDIGTDTNSVLMGFTIRGGTGNVRLYKGDYWRGGGGVQISSGGAKIVHNIISGNTVTGGGSALSVAGAAVDVYPYSLPIDNNWTILDFNIVENNTAVGDTIVGPCISIATDCRISGNIIKGNTGTLQPPSGAANTGGGILVRGFLTDTDVDTVLILENRIEGNSAAQGGGMWILGEAIRATIHKNVIVGNTCSENGGGGGMGLVRLLGAVVTSNIITGNSSLGGPGGGVQMGGNTEIHPGTTYPSAFANNVISQNSAASWGGGISVMRGSGTASILAMTNNTVVGNTAAAGANVYVQAKMQGSSYLYASNSIFWGSSNSVAGPGVYIVYSAVQGGFAGEGNISLDPKFVSGDSLYQLMNTSPALGAGRDTITVEGVFLQSPATDLLGTARPRPAGTNPDLGAVENDSSRYSQTIVRVPHDQPTVQAGINAAANGDTVLVAEGTYYENVIIAKKIVLGSYYIIDGDTTHISRTIVDGSTPANPDSATVITITTGSDTTTVIAGLTIQKGKGTYGVGTYGPYRYGGGILANAGVTIKDNIIVDNYIVGAEGVGGVGITIFPISAPVFYAIVENNIIMNNTATCTNAAVGAEAGGIYISANGRLTNNTVKSNSVFGTGAGYGVGGGIGVFGETGYAGPVVELSRNLIQNNTAGTNGGGVHSGIDPSLASIPSVTLTNNIITGNSAPTRGGAFFGYGGNYVFMHNTIVGNNGPEALQFNSGRGIANGRFLNNIISDPNCTQEISSIVGSYAVNISAQYNCIRGGYSGTGNISTDPDLEPHSGYFYLRGTSPAINAGVASADVGGTTLTAPAKDFRDSTRVGNPDLGAHEFDALVGVERLDAAIPTRFELSQNYPNPFNPRTEIRYQISEVSKVSLKVFDILGRVVTTLVDEEQPAGVYRAEWNAAVSSGVYFYKLEAVGKEGRAFVETKKLLLLK